MPDRPSGWRAVSSQADLEELDWLRRRNGHAGQLAEAEAAAIAARADPATVAALPAALPGVDPLPGEPWTELGYARRLVKVYGGSIRHVPAWNRWLVWDGRRWQVDPTNSVTLRATLVARRQTERALALGDDGKELLRAARRLETAHSVAGILRLAAAQEGVAVEPDDLDAHPLLLNCANGVLDLRTGALGPHDPDLLLTKITRARFKPSASGEVFERFLARIQPVQAMRDFLARQLGHALEGRVTEHLLPIWIGRGGNGKTALIEAVMHALGDYAGPADPELLTARTFAAHPTGQADLFGLRLASLAESDEGRRLAEGTVKRLTGGDRVKARRMREDFWSFEPSHSFVMLTNHRPEVAGKDEGIWRRLRIVPFDVVIPPAEQDSALGERLAAEADAVLAWLHAGYERWRTFGLDEPDQVRQATEEYRADSDALARFIEDRCFTGPHHLVRSSELYEAWRTWCGREGIEHPGTNTDLTKALGDKGFSNRHSRVGTVIDRIGLAAEDTEGDAR